MPRLEFSESVQYTVDSRGIALPVSLSFAGKRTSFPASIDTGAANCLFARKRGEAIGLNLESGDPRRFRTATGSVTAFGHTVTIETLGLACDSVVYFFEDSRLQHNLLGRTGWLDRIRLGLVDYEQTIYLAQYDYGRGLI